jgi:hypothetical protein
MKSRTEKSAVRIRDMGMEGGLDSIWRGHDINDTRTLNVHFMILHFCSVHTIR